MKYSVILADIPHVYKDKALAGQRGAGCKYPLMSDNDLMALPVNSASTDDAFLFFWATFPKLKESISIMESWGFEYRTVAFTWVKTNKISDSLFWGMGAIGTRSNAEVCLLGVKGKPKRASAAVHSVILSKIEKHSRKPIESYERIEQLVGEMGPKLELFATRSRDGWTCLGYDIDGRDIRETLPEVISE